MNRHAIKQVIPILLFAASSIVIAYEQEGQRQDLQPTAGISAPRSVPVIVDTTPPVITAKVNPAPDANGWNASAVTVTFSCNDTGSGVAQCSPPVRVTESTPGTLFVGTAVDNRGNRSTTYVSVRVR